MGQYIGNICLLTAGRYGSDCTAQFAVEMLRDCTVDEFIYTVLRVNPEEWGDIKIANGLSVSYKNGKLIDDLSSEIASKQIKRIYANGGWSLMNYVIETIPEHQPVTDVDLTDNGVPTMVINPREETITIPSEAYEKLLADPTSGVHVTFNGQLYRLVVK